MLNFVFAVVLPFLALNQAGQLRQLLDDGQPQEAYALAETLADAYAGDPDFDFFYGLAALDAGYPAEATFAFERIIMFDHGTPRVRLELARAYFVLGNYDSAAEEFKRVLLLDPPRHVRDKVERFLQAIQEQKNTLSLSHSGSVSVLSGYDSNINSATSDSQIFSDLLNSIVTLSDDSREQADAFVGVGAQYNMSFPLSQKKAVFGGVSFSNHTNGSTSDFDTNSLTLSGGYLFGMGVARVRIPLTLQTYYLGGEQIRNSFSMGLDWSESINRKSQRIHFGLLSMAQNPEDGNKDSVTFIAGTGATRSISRWPINMMGSLFIGNEHYSETEYLGKYLLGTRLSVSYQKVRHHFTFNVVLQQALHEEEDPSFINTREDTFMNMAFLWSWILDDALVMTTKIEYTDNHSNLQLYDYDRIQTQIGIEYRF